MATFEKALSIVYQYEGGYVNHPDDPGGETNMGITVAVARENGYDGPMKDIPITIVQNIYRTRYWAPIHGEKILHQDIADYLFDMAVNCGVKTAVKTLQRAYNSLQDSGNLLSKIVVDGIIGEDTIRAINSSLAVDYLYRAFQIERIIYYRDICEKNAKLKTFFYGWIRRSINE